LNYSNIIGVEGRFPWKSSTFISINLPQLHLVCSRKTTRRTQIYTRWETSTIIANRKRRAKYNIITGTHAGNHINSSLKLMSTNISKVSWQLLLWWWNYFLHTVMLMKSMKTSITVFSSQWNPLLPISSLLSHSFFKINENEYNRFFFSM